jgi:glycosyltransferase involved in cell wall biosynthesis
MSRGKAVVGSAVGGILDMIEDERTGLLVAPGDVTALTRAMTRLLAEPDLRQRLGSAAQAATAPFTADYVASGFEALYRGLSGTPGPIAT